MIANTLAPAQTQTLSCRFMAYFKRAEFWHRTGLTSRKRGRKAKAEAPRIKELERENARLQRRLARVETMLEIQKKASELLGIPLNPIDDDEND